MSSLGSGGFYTLASLSPSLEDNKNSLSSCKEQTTLMCLHFCFAYSIVVVHISFVGEPYLDLVSSLFVVCEKSDSCKTNSPSSLYALSLGSFLSLMFIENEQKNLWLVAVGT